MKKDIQIAVRMTTELRDELTALAEKDRRSLSAYVRILLEEHAASKKAERVTKRAK